MTIAGTIGNGEHSDVLDKALALARRGFRIFPLVPDGRKPVLSDWPAKATADETALTGWWQIWPQANIGICTSGLLVVDVDVKHGKLGYDSLLALELNGIPFPDTLTTLTPSGGRHLFYRPDKSIRNGVNTLGAGLDIRGEHGYVIAPGSRVPEGVYAFLDADAPIAIAPEALQSRCAASEQAPVVQTPPIAIDQELAVQRAREWLITTPLAIEGEGGDARTYTVICHVRDFGVSEAHASEVLAEWNTRCIPSWDQAELARKIANAYQYAKDSLGNLAPEVLFKNIRKPGALRTAGDIDLAAVLNPDYLVKGWLDRGTSAILFGEWNAGKTFVALDLAAHLAAGTSWFGCRVRKARVLYLGYEGLRALDKRVAALMRERIPTLTDLPFAWQALVQPLITPAGRTALVTILAAFAEMFDGAPELVIIDTLSKALGGDDADAEKIGTYNTLVQELLAKQRCTVLTLHHPGRADKSRERGHSSIPAAADTVLRLQDGEITATKQRDEAKGRLGFELVPMELGRDPEGDPVTTCTVRQITLRQADFEEKPLRRTDAAILAVLETLTLGQEAVSREDWFAACPPNFSISIIPGTIKRAFDNAVMRLIDLLAVEEIDGKYRCRATYTRQ